jgi:hypothetical protein
MPRKIAELKTSENKKGQTARLVKKPPGAHSAKRGNEMKRNDPKHYAPRRQGYNRSRAAKE